jgi:hypothetical protein
VIITIGILLLLGAAVALLSRGNAGAGTELEWDGYLNRRLESTERILGPMARSLGRSGAVARMAENSKGTEQLRRLLELGGAFGGVLQIYWSMQLAAVVVGSFAVAFSFLEGISGGARVILLTVGVLIAAWPYNKARNEAKRKTEIVLEQLPDFAELLLMTISSVSVPQALAFTAERVDGVVAADLRELVRMLNGAGRGREEQVFAITAARLGTTEGREFVAALQSAYLEGTTAAANIRAQVENLRMLKYQQQRGRAKRLPVTLVVTFAVHFMPLLFILSFLPVIGALSGLG